MTAASDGTEGVAPARLVIATNNPAKLSEFRRLLAGASWQPISLAEAGFSSPLDEPGPGYVENALAKAATVSARLGLPALADDSGIEVDALRGWPGPLSARWLGGGATDQQRTAGLLAEVEASTPVDRRARYVCVVALCRPGAEPLTARGECLGTIVEPAGSGGFGYDPIFLSNDLGRRLAEVSAEEKDSVSHRARALRRLAESGVLEEMAADF